MRSRSRALFVSALLLALAACSGVTTASPSHPPMVGDGRESAAEPGASTTHATTDRAPTARTHLRVAEITELVSARLRIQLTEPAVQASPDLRNPTAKPTATIEKLELGAEAWVRDDPQNPSFRPLTEDDLALIVIEAEEIEVRGLTGIVVRHAAPNGSFFTLRDILAAVEETERRTRGHSEWLDGIDVHHVYFEGLELGDDGVYDISWGS